MKRFSIHVLCFSILGLSSWLPNGADAGEFGRRSVSRYMDWEPTDCSEPLQPSFYCNDKYSCESAIDEFNSYVEEVNSYFQCITSEAETDIHSTRSSIVDGLEEAESRVKDELQNARSDLESEIEGAGFSLR